MKFNVAKSATMAFAPYKNNKCVSCAFPCFMLDGCPVAMINKCKYLGHFLSVDEDDNVDILNQNRLLYARTNLLKRKFSQCSKDVKLSLFKAFCMNFYGDCLWNRYNVTVIKRFEAAYIKCVKMFFGYYKYHSVTSMLLDLGLPTVSTILHNARMRLGLCVESHENEVVHDICK
jgi:hypothetical protein